MPIKEKRDPISKRKKGFGSCGKIAKEIIGKIEDLQTTRGEKKRLNESLSYTSQIKRGDPFIINPG